MARPLWKGAITFGLVSIPIEVHTAVRDRQLRFHLLTERDKSRVKYQRVSEKTGKPVDWNDLVKGYEYSKGRYVVLTREDFEAAALEKTRTIDILDFVKSEEIDDRYFDKPYYVTPGAGGDHAYALLRETIREEGRIGIAKFVMRERQYLAALEVIDKALVLSTLRFADELVDTAEYKFPAGKVNARELKIARMLVNELASDWDPDKYTDDYRENLLRIIDAKRKGKEAELEPETAAPAANVVDLMERLRSSLEGAGRGGRKRAKPSRAARAKRTRRRGTREAA
jgi:DNA end-binding protein Ku